MASAPDNTDYQRDLSISDEEIGNVVLAQGDLVGALAAYRDSLAIAKALAQKDPSNTQWQILKRLGAEGKLTASQKGWIATIEAALAKAS